MFRPLATPVIERIVTFSCRWKGLMILASLLLALGAGFYTATHFAMNTNSGKLISADVGWRKRQDDFDRLFPQQSNLILVVVDGATPELAEAGAGALTARLSQNKALFPGCEPSRWRTVLRSQWHAVPAAEGCAGHHPAIVQGAAFPGRAGGRSVIARRDGQSFHRAPGHHPRPGQAFRHGSAHGAVWPGAGRRGTRPDRLSLLARADHRAPSRGGKRCAASSK